MAIDDPVVRIETMPGAAVACFGHHVPVEGDHPRLYAPTGGEIHRLGPDLEPNDDVDFPSPWPNPGGLAYVSSVQIGFPPMNRANLLAVANTSDNRVRFVDLDNPERPFITTINLAFPPEDIPDGV